MFFANKKRPAGSTALGHFLFIFVSIFSIIFFFFWRKSEYLCFKSFSIPVVEKRISLLLQKIIFYRPYMFRASYSSFSQNFFCIIKSSNEFDFGFICIEKMKKEFPACNWSCLWINTTLFKIKAACVIAFS